MNPARFTASNRGPRTSSNPSRRFLLLFGAEASFLSAATMRPREQDVQPRERERQEELHLLRPGDAGVAAVHVREVALEVPIHALNRVATAHSRNGPGLKTSRGKRERAPLVGELDVERGAVRRTLSIGEHLLELIVGVQRIMVEQHQVLDLGAGGERHDI